LVQEQVVVFQDLRVSRRAKEVDCTFRQECTVASIVACLSSISCEEFREELGILVFAFDSNNVSCYFIRVASMADSHAVDFKVGKDCNKFVSVGHCLDLCLFQVGSKGNCSCYVDFDQHKLIHKMIAKVQEMGDIGCYFCKEADSGRTFGSQAIGFDEDLGLF